MPVSTLLWGPVGSQPQDFRGLPAAVGLKEGGLVNPLQARARGWASVLLSSSEFRAAVLRLHRPPSSVGWGLPLLGLTPGPSLQDTALTVAW